MSLLYWQRSPAGHASSSMLIEICGIQSKGFIMDDHKHLREIDCSLAATWAMALNLGVNQYTGPAISAKACFWWQSTTNVNKGRQAWPMSGLFI